MIRLKLSEHPVQWIDKDGAHMVGRRLLDETGEIVIVRERSNGTRYYLVRLSQPITDVLVRCDEPTLKPYPSSPIPEPTNTGRRDY